MLKKLFMGLGIFLAGILTIAAFRSDKMHVSREIIIFTNAEKIFPYVNNSKKSYEWMPWAESDPGIEIKYSGPEEGIGSNSSWNGKEMGVGSSEIIEVVPNQVVITKLVYTKPFEMSQIAKISLTPMNEGTRVQWSVDGHNNFFFRIMGVFIDCDTMIGDEFQKGLNKLKFLVEKN